jgi:hypothetical protein
MGGCNCGKPKPGPLGQNKPTPGGGLSAQTQSFTLQDSSGRTSTFSGSLLEAQARAVRTGSQLKKD